MKKSHLVVAGIVSFLLIITGILYIVVNNGQESVSEQKDELIPRLPYNSAGPVNNGLGSEKNLIIEDPESPNQIKEFYDEYTKNEMQNTAEQEKYLVSVDYPPTDKNGKLVDLDLFFNSINAKINPNLKNLVGTNYYSLMYCADQDGQKDYAIIFDAGGEQISTLKFKNKQVQESLKEWEPSMLKDLHSVLFPSVVFGDNLLDQKLNFKDGLNRYAELSLPDDHSSINYQITEFPGNLVVISSSSECINKILSYFEALE